MFSFPALTLGLLGIWLGDSWSPNYLLEESNRSDLRTRGCCILSGFGSTAWHTGVISKQSQGLGSRGGVGGVSGQEKEFICSLAQDLVDTGSLLCCDLPVFSQAPFTGRTAGKVFCEPLR